MFPSMDTPWTFCRRNQQNFRAQQLQRREVSLPPNAPLSKCRLSRRQSSLSLGPLTPAAPTGATRSSAASFTFSKAAALPAPDSQEPELSQPLEPPSLWLWLKHTSHTGSASQQKGGRGGEEGSNKAGPAKPGKAEAETSIKDLWLGCSI